MKRVLVTALCSCADSRRRPQARSFLQGLSGDELQYIAEFLGASILESSGGIPRSRAQLAQRIADFEKHRHGRGCLQSCCDMHDQDHKMILLLEYLCRTGLPKVSEAVRAAGNS